LEGAMTKGKLFTTGGNQAVRLPEKPIASWDEYFDWVRTLDLPCDFLRERHQPADDLRDPMLGHRRGRIPARYWSRLV
jgi:hypothetical protein